MRFLMWLGVTAVAICLAASPGAAGEFNLTHYPPGTNTVAPARVPPPGKSVLLNYITYYSSERLNNSRGESAVPTYGVDVIGEAVRVVHTWTAVRGVSCSSGVVVPITDAELIVPNRRESGGGFGDLVIQPLLLTAAFGDLQVLAGFDVSVPTGRFSTERLVNPGLNYYTVAPQFAVTWLPTKKVEVSLYSNVGFNFENPATKYSSGHYIVTDYAVGHRPVPSLPALQVSAVGYLLHQFTDDQVRGERFRDGNRGEVFAIGPQIRYQVGRGGIVLKWYREMMASNRPIGNRFQFQIAIPF